MQSKNTINTEWVIITGGPCSGKSTLLEAFKNDGEICIQEAARTVIDEGLAIGKKIEEIRANEESFQDIVLQRKIQIETENK